MLNKAIDSFADMFTNLKKPVYNIAELTDQQEYMKSVLSDLEKMQAGIDDNIKLCDLLQEKYNYKLTHEVLD